MPEDGRGLVQIMVRGDHRVNETKLRNVLGGDFRPARPDEFEDVIGPAGYIGPVGRGRADHPRRGGRPGGYVTGANKPDTHLRGVEPGRDFPFERADVRVVEAGDTVNGHAIRIEPAIEIGNIFKLGTRYSEPLGATYLDEEGKQQLIHMGSYGIGPRGSPPRRWSSSPTSTGSPGPARSRPGTSSSSGLGKEGTPERELAERLYEELRGQNLDVLYDDRAAGPGEKFADAELVGVPLRLTVGRRTLESGELEAQVRRGREQRSVPLDGRGGGGGGAVAQPPVERTKLTFRRLSGLDRSGPPPPQTLSGQPLHPWTIPNAIGYVRLALIPVFLILAFNSENGTDPLPAIIFAVIGWSDYLDGIAARVTGQYSRLGTLLDPLVDRLLVLSGVIVCWHFELLPRWGLALLAARELFVVGLVRYRDAPWRRSEGQLARPRGRLAHHGRAVLRNVRRRVAGRRVPVRRPGPRTRLRGAVCSGRHPSSLDVNLRIAMLATQSPQERTATS